MCWCAGVGGSIVCGGGLGAGVLGWGGRFHRGGGGGLWEHLCLCCCASGAVGARCVHAIVQQCGKSLPAPHSLTRPLCYTPPTDHHHHPSLPQYCLPKQPPPHTHTHTLPHAHHTGLRTRTVSPTPPCSTRSSPLRPQQWAPTGAQPWTWSSSQTLDATGATTTPACGTCCALCATSATTSGRCRTACSSSWGHCQTASTGAGGGRAGGRQQQQQQGHTAALFCGCDWGCQ